MESENTPEKCTERNHPLKVIQHNDAKFIACDLRNRDLGKCRSCLTPFCQKPLKVYHNSRNYLACDVTNSTRSLPANPTSTKNRNLKEQDSTSLWHWLDGTGSVDCLAPKCKTSSKCSTLTNKVEKCGNSSLQEFVKPKIPKFRTKAFKLSILKENNKYRKLHNASPLKMDKELSSYAQEWADHLADQNLLETRPLPIYGENILCVRKPLFCVDKIMKLWYQEKYNYDYFKPGFNLYTGHFTQMVWRETEFLGVGVAFNDSHIWIVCNYNPPGNVKDHFKENVQPRKFLLSHSNQESDTEKISRPKNVRFKREKRI
ncbi:uncharacterized protein [Drosophila suzukii]|uniref:SCP domain-containing protein n=1 Tax=Drosophila suzukii TaxID=28584 RepID=A0AB39YYV4_DROSZ